LVGRILNGQSLQRGVSSVFFLFWLFSCIVGLSYGMVGFVPCWSVFVHTCFSVKATITTLCAVRNKTSTSTNRRQKEESQQWTGSFHQLINGLDSHPDPQSIVSSVCFFAILYGQFRWLLWPIRPVLWSDCQWHSCITPASGFNSRLNGK
jgi:hypothetical protein